MTYPKPESWRDDFDLDPNVDPAIAHAIHQMHIWHAADMANRRAGLKDARWPFPAQPIPVDRRRPAPTQPDAEDAPW